MAVDDVVASCSNILATPSTTAKDRVHAYVIRASAYGVKGRYDLAISDYTNAIQIDARNANLHYARAWAYMGNHQFDLALADYNEAVRIQPDAAGIYDARGEFYMRSSREDLAIADYSRAIRLEPDNEIYLSDRARAYVRQGQYALAIADFTAMLRVKPNNATTYTGRGVAYQRIGQLDLAIADYNESIRLGPHNTGSHSHRASAYRDKGQLALAIADYDQELRLDRRNPSTILALHIAHLEAGDDDRDAFAASAAGMYPTQWPAPIVALYLGTTTPEQVLAGLSTGQRCNAQFSIAQWQLLRGQHNAEARAGFEWVVKNCAPALDASRDAKAELARFPSP
jgi:tetratricopeptide (TPR) repeat protein